MQLTFDEICELLARKVGVRSGKTETFCEAEFVAYIRGIFAMAKKEKTQAERKRKKRDR